MHARTAQDTRARQPDRKLKPPPARAETTSSRRITRHTSSTKGQDVIGGDDDSGDVVDDDVLRTRVRQRIQQRVRELQLTNEATHAPAVRSMDTPLFMDSLHQDVVQTAAQILGKYLSKAHASDEPLELALVHRMLVKEVELQTLQRQRASVQ